MITSIEVQNIRAFDEHRWEFPVLPVTILCGTNSSGKSTLLKTLLLLKQSMGIGENFDAKDGRLRFFGSQVDLGDYRTFVSHNDTSKNIVIGITNVAWMPIKAAAMFDSSLLSINEGNTEESRVFKKKKNSIQYTLSSEFVFGLKEKQSSGKAVESNFRTLAKTDNGHLKFAKFELNIQGKVFADWFVEYAGDDDDGDPTYFLYIQSDCFQKLDKETLSNMTVDDTTKPGYVKVTSILSGLTPRAYFVAETAKKDDTNKKRWNIFKTPEVIYNVCEQLKEMLENIDYIGPLRSPAKRYYITQSEYIPNSDPTGEFLPSILKDIEKYDAWYVLPRTFSSDVEKGQLLTALNIWLHYLRAGETIVENGNSNEISLESTKVLLEFRIKSFVGNELHALSDSGFGYSQLLPILVRALKAAPGSTIIIEQPELHLNPAIQVRMAEFLVAMALSNKTVIVETHSEHIVNTIRVLVAEDETGKLYKLAKIFYIDTASQKPIIHELSIQPDGTVPKWPKPFFGEAVNMAGRLLRAQKRFRK